MLTRGSCHWQRHAKVRLHTEADYRGLRMSGNEPFKIRGMTTFNRSCSICSEPCLIHASNAGEIRVEKCHYLGLGPIKFLFGRGLV